MCVCVMCLRLCVCVFSLVAATKHTSTLHTHAMVTTVSIGRGGKRVEGDNGDRRGDIVLCCVQAHSVASQAVLRR